MNKKNTQILLSILHICILGICILTIYPNRNRASEAMVAHVSSDTRVIDSHPEPETDPATGTATDTDTISETETGTATDANTPEPSTEPEEEAETAAEADTGTEPAPSYSFRYTGTYLNLNIRSAPSLNDTIIGKIPPGQGGSVIELTNDEWALIDYLGTIGYCSRDYIELQETEDKFQGR